MKSKAAQNCGAKPKAAMRSGTKPNAMMRSGAKRLGILAGGEAPGIRIEADPSRSGGGKGIFLPFVHRHFVTHRVHVLFRGLRPRLVSTSTPCQKAGALFQNFMFSQFLK